MRLLLVAALAFLFGCATTDPCATAPGTRVASTAPLVLHHSCEHRCADEEFFCGARCDDDSASNGERLLSSGPSLVDRTCRTGCAQTGEICRENCR